MKAEKFRNGTSSLHPIDSDAYKTVREIMDNFEWDYTQFAPELARFQDFQNTHDNNVDEDLFPTISKAAVPYLYISIRELLPDQLEWMFPEEVKTVRMTPQDRSVSMEQIENVEWALQWQVLNRMKLKRACLPTLYDSLKAGLGYGAIEPYVYSPPVAVNRFVLRGGEPVVSERGMGIGKPVHSIRYRHVGLGQIIVSKDGNDFNGPHRVTNAYRFDSYDEDEFIRMFEQELDVEDIELNEDVDASMIVEQARTMGFHSRVPIHEIQHALGGYNFNVKTGNENVKVRVPVLKVYTPNRHLWIANGTTIIYDKESTVETLHTPLVKATSAIDGTRWAPMSDAEASQTIGWTQNVWVNLMMDAAVRSVMPRGFYNKDVMDYPPTQTMDGMTGVPGSPQEHVYFPQSQQMDNSHFTFYQILQGLHDSSAGKRDMQSNAQPGMLRSGIHAFESLMQTMTGRARLGASIMQMGFLEPIFKQAFLYMQLFADNQGETFAMRQYDQETRKEGLKHISVTHDDLLHGFDIEIDLNAKAGGGLNFNERIQEFQALNQDPYVDPYEVRMNMMGDQRKARRTIYSRERIAEIEEEQRRQAEEEAMAQQEPAAATEAGQMAVGAGLQQEMM